MKSLGTNTDIPQEQNSDDEFYDAKESWEDNRFESTPLPKDKPPLTIGASFKSATGTSRKPFPLPLRMADKEAFDFSVFWSSGLKKTQYSSGKTVASDTLTGKDFLSSQKTNSPTSKGEFGLPKSSSYTIGELPIQPLHRHIENPQVIKSRNRVPPIAIIRTQKSMKDKLEFDNLCLQQELRSGAQAIWVARFSTDGCFFAVGGEEHIIRVWEVGDYSQQCNLYSE